jgi:NADH-quinone oxidoreductase subunit L
MHHEQDMRRMGGLKKYMPVTFATMLTGWLAICGVLPFAGFFSKDEILWKTWSTGATAIPSWAGKTLWVVGALTALLTAVYMTRLMVLTFWGGERFREAHAGGQADEAHAHAYDEGDKAHDAKQFSAGDRPRHEPGTHVADAHASAHASAHADDDGEDEHDAHHQGPVTPHESPWTMTVPLVVLALLSTFGGLVGVPYALSGGAFNNYFEHALEPVVERAPQRGGGHAEVGTGDASHSSPATAHGASPAPATESHAQTTSPPSHGNEGALPPSVGEGQRGGAPAAEHAHDPAEVRAERIFSGISLAIAAAGIVGGFMYFKKNPLKRMPRLLENKYYIDEAYDAAIINPIKTGSREGLWKIFDVKVVDGLVNGLARATSGVGDIARRLQAGFVRGYAAVILLGALLVIGYFVFNFTRVLSHL